ncbi:hypothetical protein [Eggerthella lenta]|uniref:hypothetical protein n=1 Tax=Eggerthella lenta TaxID=84112 RepID=UPI001FBBCF2A|nr:hypothetical protein [Eggerthella lenta]GKG82850.1 hypothetical protein CE91St34_01110 [Eggerthella lenta]GKG85957.1 hypothetical protein CE91St35_01110 [Eggerthella lenta]DAL81922.1 MAG TPA: Protein of unknown function (DUF669) [Caudoviricetes sp.]
MAEMQDEVLDWDLTEADPDDGSHGGWTVLEDGFYPFTVQKMERARFEGSAKMPACPMAVLTLKVQGAGGEEALVTQRVYLLQRMLWKVTQFMEAIGQGRNERGKVVVNWGDVEGRGGWLKLKKRSYTNRDGQERETNDVDCFCKPEEHEKAWRAYAKQCGEDPDAALSAPQAQQAPAQQAYAPQAASYAPQAAPQPQQQYQQQAMAGMPTPQPQAGASQHPGWGIQ